MVLAQYFLKSSLGNSKLWNHCQKKTNGCMKKGQQFIRYIAVILLQIVYMVSPGTHLVKNHESLSITNESQLKTMR